MKSSSKLFVFGMVESRSWKKIIEASHLFHIFYFLGNSKFLLSQTNNTAQKMKFSIKDLFSKCDEIRRKLRIWSHLLNKPLMENFNFCAE